MEEKRKTTGLKEVAIEVIGWENNKVISTLKYLTLKPGQVISEFCGGEKHKYLSPVVYYGGIVSLRLSLISISGLSDFLLKEQLRNVQRWSSTIFPSDAVSDKTTIDNLGGFFSFFMTPIGQEIINLPILLLFTWLFYKRFNHSFKENSWFALYTWSHAYLLSIPAIFLWYVTKNLTLYAALTIPINLLYWTWVSMKFYNLKIVKALTLRIFMQVALLFCISAASNLFPGFKAVYDFLFSK